MPATYTVKPIDPDNVIEWTRLKSSDYLYYDLWYRIQQLYPPLSEFIKDNSTANDYPTKDVLYAIVTLLENRTVGISMHQYLESMRVKLQNTRTQKFYNISDTDAYKIISIIEDAHPVLTAQRVEGGYALTRVTNQITPPDNEFETTIAQDSVNSAVPIASNGDHVKWQSVSLTLDNVDWKVLRDLMMGEVVETIKKPKIRRDHYGRPING